MKQTNSHEKRQCIAHYENEKRSKKEGQNKSLEKYILKHINATTEKQKQKYGGFY